MEVSEGPPYLEYVGDEGDGVECGDERWMEARHPHTAAYRGQLALALQEHRRIVRFPVI